MSDDSVTIEINGTACRARKGAMIMEVADAAGIVIPRFCYHKKLSVAANCRMCLVEVAKTPKPLPACATPVMDGMQVFTGSPLALQAQRSVMEFLLINHPLDCPICDQGGECELQDTAMGYGRDISRFSERKRVVADKDLGPLIATDMTRCIHCTRCVRFGEEIAGLPELGVTGRGEDIRIGTFIERAVSSELSGNVIDVCPVGALTSKPFRFKARAWEVRQCPGLAPHDGVGSNLYVHVKRNRVVRVVPRDNDEVNESWLSDRDRFSYEGLYSDDRLGAPRVKRDGTWQEVDWETALQAAADGLRRVREQHGAERLGALGSPSATLEELYLLQKLMRGTGSNNIDHRLRQGDFSDDGEAPGVPWLGRALASLEDAGATLLVGSDCRRDQPLVNHRLRKCVRGGGVVCAVNPLDYGFNYPLGTQVIGAPEVMSGALAGIAKALTGEPLSEAGAQCTALLDAVEVDEAHARIAQFLSEAERPAVLLGAMGLALPNAARLRALAGLVAERAGATFGYLADGANAVGACLAGALPHRGPGAERKLSPAGLNVGEMIAAKLEGWLLLGVEPELDCHDGRGALEALSAARHVVCLSAFRSAAMDDYADVILPIAPFAENTGTFVNLEGRWQSWDAAVTPFATARPAWKALRVLGNLLGIDGFQHVDCAEVREEAAGVAGGDLADCRGAWRVPKPKGTVPAGLCRIGHVPMVAVDSLVRRAPALQRTVHAVGAQAIINSATARRLRLGAGDSAAVRQNGACTTLDVRVSDSVADDCVVIPAGVSGSAGLGPACGPVEIEKV